jgi:hypothetical protein
MNIFYDSTKFTIELNELEAKNLWYQLAHSVDLLREDRSVALRPFDYDSDDYQRLNDDYNYHINNNIQIREAINDFLDQGRELDPDEEDYKLIRSIHNLKDYLEGDY